MGRKHQAKPPDPFDPLDGPISATLDVHGFIWTQARDAALAFLEFEARRKPGSLVHIVTGKGRGSAGGPVLLPRMRSLLRNGDLPAVASWGLDLDGGGFLVRLRS